MRAKEAIKRLGNKQVTGLFSSIKIFLRQLYAPVYSLRGDHNSWHSILADLFSFDGNSLLSEADIYTHTHTHKDRQHSHHFIKCRYSAAACSWSVHPRTVRYLTLSYSRQHDPPHKGGQYTSPITHLLRCITIMHWRHVVQLSLTLFNDSARMGPHHPHLAGPMTSCFMPITRRESFTGIF